MKNPGFQAKLAFREDALTTRLSRRIALGRRSQRRSLHVHGRLQPSAPMWGKYRTPSALNFAAERNLQQMRIRITAAWKRFHWPGFLTDSRWTV